MSNFVSMPTTVRDSVPDIRAVHHRYTDLYRQVDDLPYGAVLEVVPPDPVAANRLRAAVGRVRKYNRSWLRCSLRAGKLYLWKDEAE